MAEVFATSYAGVPFFHSERRPDGTTWHVLRLEDPALEPGLATAWLKLAEAGQLRTVWPGGALSISEMFEWAKTPNMAAFASFLESDNTLEFVGLGWITLRTRIGLTPEGRDAYKAEVGMSFMPRIYGTGLPEEMAAAMIDYGFQRMDLAVVYGTIPTPNALAVRFARQMGFRRLATFPEFGCWPDHDGVARPCSCEIFAVTLQDWIPAPVTMATMEDIPIPAMSEVN